MVPVAETLIPIAEGLWDRFLFWLSGRIPRRLAYFIFIRIWAFASTGRYGGDNPALLSADTVLTRWETAGK